MSEETMNQNTEQKPTNSNPEDKNGDPGSGRTFTQEEVNRIVADRLAKERAKASKSVDPETDHREQELTAREQILECRDYLETQNKNYGTNYPVELVSLFGAMDLPQFKDKLHEFERIVERMADPEQRAAPQRSAPHLRQPFPRSLRSKPPKGVIKWRLNL
ncbi:MAG: hypothetical protein ACLUEU_13730 [Oscillospiraceae bacterium]